MTPKVKGPRRMCAVCLRRPPVGYLLCGPCGRSYDRAVAKGDGTTAAVVLWCAGQVRRELRASLKKGRRP